MQWRTDLAMARYTGDMRLNGVRNVCRETDGMAVHEVEILTDEAANALGKEKGKYVTLCDESLGSQGCEEEKRLLLARMLSDAVSALLPEKGPVLVVGLGNRQITADALGSRVAEKMLVTRALKMQPDQENTGDLRSVCALAPGVLGVTGIETAEIIRGVVDKVHPSAVLAIDALAARESKRICTTIQVTDTGISPGSGVGNHRTGLNRETLGVPVIAVGVPMVVYASVIARDALEQLLHVLDMPVHMQAVEGLVHQVTRQALGELVVAPREVDELVGRAACVLALGLNMALQPALDAEEILLLTNDHL